jgi:hypothetical protein
MASGVHYGREDHMDVQHEPVPKHTRTRAPDSDLREKRSQYLQSASHEQLDGASFAKPDHQ